MMNISRDIFWDTDFDSIDWFGKPRYVITRVVRYGTLEDWREIKRVYGLETIKREMLQEPDLDPKSLAYLSLILQVPKEEFQCFIRKQSPQAPWIS